MLLPRIIQHQECRDQCPKEGCSPWWRHPEQQLNTSQHAHIWEMMVEYDCPNSTAGCRSFHSALQDLPPASLSDDRAGKTFKKDWLHTKKTSFFFFFLISVRRVRFPSFVSQILKKYTHLGGGRHVSLTVQHSPKHDSKPPFEITDTPEQPCWAPSLQNCQHRCELKHLNVEAASLSPLRLFSWHSLLSSTVCISCLLTNNCCRWFALIPFII